MLDLVYRNIFINDASLQLVTHVLVQDVFDEQLLRSGDLAQVLLRKR